MAIKLWVAGEIAKVGGRAVAGIPDVDRVRVYYGQSWQVSTFCFINTSIEARLRRASLLRRPTPAIPTPALLTPTIPTLALLRLLRHTTEGWLVSRKVYSIGS